MIKDTSSTFGIVSLELRDETGAVKSSVSTNMVVNSGLAYITQRLTGAGSNISHMAVGSGSTGGTDGTRTALEAQISNRVALDSTTRVTTNVTNDAVQYVCTFGPGVSTGAITEAGLFDAATGGAMFTRTTFPVVNKNSGDTLTITWKVTLV
jgi:hypothetical protein